MVAIGFGFPRFRRVLIMALGLGLVFYGSLLMFQDPESYAPAMGREHIQNLKSHLSYYFDENDNNDNILDSFANTDIDLEGKTLAESVKGVKDEEANHISQQFYTPLLRLMNAKKDSIPKLSLTRRATDDKGSVFTKEKLLEYLVIDTDDIPRLKDIHQEIYDALPDKFPKGLYKGTGIVLIGGGQYSWLSLLSIKSVRSFGCQLPIEMIIPTEEEYEHDLCEEILPALGGSCVLLYNVLGEEVMKEIEFKGYQYKSLALIASSFEEVLLLDSDNVLVHNPEAFFEMEPFTSTGMVTWPDYWTRTTSPHLYEIMGINVKNTRVRDGKWPLKTPVELDDISDVSYHDLEGTFPDLSTESGQLLLRKSDHLKTLLLSLFYNLYGPDFFYPLISQGFDGEGDKDTFVLGAIKGGEKFYQVKSEIQSFGWFDEGNFNGVSMGQRNPLNDYEQLKEIENSENPDYSQFDTRQAPIFTVHANFPKLNPFLLYKEEKLKNSKGEDFRMYSDISHFLPEPFDFEHVQYKRMKFLLCELNISLKYFNPISRAELCEFIEGHLKFLENNPVMN
ncbi:CYFA0S06e02564g1_1 [Cyberlindnera fabianii]|uniref:CYFA0S06e02564g1_1 n=1 Tax=Cyberlindnera fabianii TaxID=36022 RepID=A0A061B2A0_CYBFA|nr:CYFA0S06e02564g1_1 [Cyberlindnera fabianii]